MKIAKVWRNTLAASAIFGVALAWNGNIVRLARISSAADVDRPAPNGDDPNGPPPPRQDDRPPANGDRRPAGPPGVQRALDELKLTDEQKQKVDPIVQQYRQKQEQAREEFLQQMKEALTPQQFESLEKTMRRPPGPPPQEQGNRQQKPENREAAAPPPSAAPAAQGAAAASAPKDPSQVPVTFVGGYETDSRDHGRPVVLVASALGVSSDVFRKAFSNVKPASGGHEPEPEQVRLNKQTLMHDLSPYGITNERLDAVSNFYRYSASRGQMWRNTPATALATIHNGAVAAITITNPGAGYSSPPKVIVGGISDVKAEVTLSFGTEFSTNGSIKEISVKP